MVTNQRRSRYSESLRAGRFGDQIPDAARFSAPVQTCPGAHPASYTMGTGSLSPGVKRQGRDANNPPTSSAEVKERVEIYQNSPSGPLWPVIGRTLLFDQKRGQNINCCRRYKYVSMALELTQYVTKINTRDVAGGKGGRCVELTTLPPSRASCLKTLGVSTSCSSQALFKVVQGELYL
jgi:hypothetical protein